MRIFFTQGVCVNLCKQRVRDDILDDLTAATCCDCHRGWSLSMNLNGVLFALNEFEWHNLNVALNEFACCTCCSQWICMLWMLFWMNLRAVDVAPNKLEWCDVDVTLHESAWGGCCSQWICMAWMLLSMNFHDVEVAREISYKVGLVHTLLVPTHIMCKNKLW